MSTPIQNQINLYAAKFEDIKAEIANAKQRLLDVEEKIIELIGLKTEGATTEKTDYYKVTTTGRVTRKTNQDPQAMAALQAQIGTETFLDIFNIEYKLHVGAFKQLKTYDSESYIAISELVTETPAKPAVSVSPIEQKEGE